MRTSPVLSAYLCIALSAMKESTSVMRKNIGKMAKNLISFIMTYSLESTIAEKFNAIPQRFELTGRMKDFYDIYYLARTFDFDGVKLQTAISRTLERRGTPYDKDSFKRILTLAEDMDMQKRWKIFLKIIKDDMLKFSAVIEEIQTFLEPVFDTIVNEDEWQKQWNTISSWGSL